MLVWHLMDISEDGTTGSRGGGLRGAGDNSFL